MNFPTGLCEELNKHVDGYKANEESKQPITVPKDMQDCFALEVSNQLQQIIKEMSDDLVKTIQERADTINQLVEVKSIIDRAIEPTVPECDS